MFKFIQGLLMLTSADGGRKAAVRDDATYRSVFPSNSVASVPNAPADAEPVSLFDTAMSMHDTEEGVTVHDEEKKEEGLRKTSTSIATMTRDMASAIVSSGLPGNINGTEVVGNQSQFFELSESRERQESTVGRCGEATPYCRFVISGQSLQCECLSQQDEYSLLLKKDPDRHLNKKIGMKCTAMDGSFRFPENAKCGQREEGMKLNKQRGSCVQLCSGDFRRGAEVYDNVTDSERTNPQGWDAKYMKASSKKTNAARNAQSVSTVDVHDLGERKHFTATQSAAMLNRFNEPWHHAAPNSPKKVPTYRSTG